MPRDPEFNPVSTVRGWVVSYPASMTASRKRERRVFPSKTAALKAASELREKYRAGLRGSTLSASVAADAVTAMAILGDSGITLTEAARLAVARMGGSTSKETFASRYARAQAANEGIWSDKYRAQMEAIERWLPEDFMERKCGTIDRTVIEAALLSVRPLARSSLDMKSARILAVIGFRERHRKTSEIAILTPERCEKLLDACETREERRAVAMLIWAGIRPDAEEGEISKLEWDCVGESEIYVAPEISKTGSDRHIPLTPRLRKLIAGHPKEGLVAPAGWRRIWRRIRKDAGVTEFDVCRHTFGSNALAAWGEDAAKQAMGHTAGSQTLFRAYRRAITKDAALKFFGQDTEQGAE